MNSATINGNNRLPFDVLFDVFAFYAAEKSLEYPTETLLLVCKSWNLAAISNRAVWSRFRIHVAHRPPEEMLKRRILLRLERSGDTVPLDIELRNLMYMDGTPESFVESIEYSELNRSSTLVCPRRTNTATGRILPCHCKSEARECVYALATLLTGNGGVLCNRWRRVVFAPMGEWPSQWYGVHTARFFSHPTPMLVSLTLDHVKIEGQWNIPFIPHAPKLEQLALNECIIPSIPNPGHLRLLGLSWDRVDTAMYWDGILDMHTMHALEVLKINIVSTSLRFPTKLPKLRRLELRGFGPPEGVSNIEMENLCYLRIGVGNGTRLQFPGDDWKSILSRLKSIEMWFGYMHAVSVKGLQADIHTILLSLTGLETFIGDVRMLSIVLKAIWESTPIIDYFTDGMTSRPFPRRILTGREVAFKVIQGESWYKLSFHSIRQEIIELARSLGVINPEESWDYINARMVTLWRKPD